MPYKMPSKYTKILEFNQYQKPVKALFINYVGNLMDVKIILKIHLQQK